MNGDLCPKQVLGKRSASEEGKGKKKKEDVSTNKWRKKLQQT